ncbi:MAG: mercuric reductase, partial [Nitrospirae bacterium]|nr:mercuric reductase [Nitrospirota bacterium]
GAGPAGLVCAAGAAGLGARVALVERHLMGGDCLNVGCVPSKGLIRADFARVMERMYRIRAELSHHDSPGRFSGLGVDVFLGEGRFAGPRAVAVAGKTLRFRHAVIATGARAALPAIPGLADCQPLTNETVFGLAELPARLAVIGSGPIGCELGQAFARLGSRVTLLEKANRIMGRDEAKAAETVSRSLARDGVRIVTGATILGAANHGGHKTLAFRGPDGAETIEVDAILVTAGRAPNVEGLGLDVAGIRYDTQGGVAVDAHLRTSNPMVFAAGDVCFPYKFTHAADACARIVIANALFKGRQRADRLVVPWATYTQPEVAHVGLSEAEAGDDVDVIEVPTAATDRGRLDGDDGGYARVYLKKGTDRVVGATLVADHAGDMIGEMALAVTHRIGLKKVGSTIHPYPTTGEIWKKVADAYSRTRLTPTVHKWMTRWLAWTR